MYNSELINYLSYETMLEANSVSSSFISTRTLYFPFFNRITNTNPKIVIPGSHQILTNLPRGPSGTQRLQLRTHRQRDQRRRRESYRDLD